MLSINSLDSLAFIANFLVSEFNLAVDIPKLGVSNCSVVTISDSLQWSLDLTQFYLYKIDVITLKLLLLYVKLV